MKRLVPIIALVACLGLSACKSTLEPGGAYAPTTTNAVTGVITATQAPDMAFYNIDSAYLLAYSTANAAFDFERNNRAMLWKISPQIKHTLDTIRPQAVAANMRYLAARASYLANPVPAGLTQLQTILAEIGSIASAAQVAIALPATPAPTAVTK